MVVPRLGSVKIDDRHPGAAGAVHPRSGDWLEEPGFGIYVHIPFCRHRCHYCDFNTYEGQDALHAPYVDALIADIERWPTDVPEATSVFFGGGTPSLLPVVALECMLSAIRARFELSPDAEVTIEVNPETVDEASFAGLLAAGFDRFSIGVQSLAPAVLAALGRTHSAERALGAVTAARRAGVDDLNVDLIYGSPWERPRDWTASLDGVIEASPDHVSAYALTVEDGTPLATLVATGRVDDVDPDVQAERFEVASEMLGSAGYVRYEISNWARAHRASRHNVLYWSAGDYLGFGAGAHAHIAGRRWWAERLPRAYVAAVAAGLPTEAGAEALDDPQRAAEALMLGLRLASGISMEGFDRRFGAAWRPTHAGALESLEADGLVEVAGDRLRATERGTLFASEIARSLL